MELWYISCPIILFGDSAISIRTEPSIKGRVGWGSRGGGGGERLSTKFHRREMFNETLAKTFTTNFGLAKVNGTNANSSFVSYQFSSLTSLTKTRLNDSYGSNVNHPTTLILPFVNIWKLSRWNLIIALHYQNGETWMT